MWHAHDRIATNLPPTPVGCLPDGRCQAAHLPKDSKTINTLLGARGPGRGGIFLLGHLKLFLGYEEPWQHAQ
jgi:hypothetical protein